MQGLRCTPPSQSPLCDPLLIPFTLATHLLGSCSPGPAAAGTGQGRSLRATRVQPWHHKLPAWWPGQSPAWWALLFWSLGPRHLCPLAEVVLFQDSLQNFREGEPKLPLGLQGHGGGHACSRSGSWTHAVHLLGQGASHLEQCPLSWGRGPHDRASSACPALQTPEPPH